jgi:hypothetical protein
MKAGRWIAVGALVAAAVVLALLAHDVRAWSAAFARDDLRAEARAPGARTWRGDSVLPASWTEGLLGLAPDRNLRLAIQRFRATYARPPGFDGGIAAVRARDAAEVALSEVARDGNAERASQALDLLALMQFGDSTAGAGSGAATRAVAGLQQAIALDPGNTPAKANLELVFRLLRTSGSRPGSSAAAGPRSTGHHGAGSGTPGAGY